MSFSVCKFTKSEHRHAYTTEKVSVFEVFLACTFRIRTEYEYLLSKSLHSFQMRENADEKNSEYGHFLCSVILLRIFQNSRNISFWEYYLTAAFEKITFFLFSCNSVLDILFLDVSTSTETTQLGEREAQVKDDSKELGTGIIVAVAAAAVVSVTMLIAGTIYIYRRFCKNQGVVSFEI